MPLRAKRLPPVADPPVSKNIHRYAAEALGTFGIVFFGCGAIMLGSVHGDMIDHVSISLVFGTAVAVMIYTLGHISGAHFNPAVTLAFAISRHFPARELAGYWSGQLAGAILASLLLSFLIPDAATNGETGLTVTPLRGLAWEIAISFFLMLVIMGVATDTRAVGMMAGIAIGATVFLCALLGGPFTGASMNPARTLGPAIVSGYFAHFWVYVLGPFLGTALGALTYQWLRGQPIADKDP